MKTPDNFDNYTNSTGYFLSQSKSYNILSQKGDEVLSKFTDNTYTSQPLCVFGEIIGYLIGYEILSPLSSIYSNYSSEIVLGIGILTSFFLYKKVVNLYFDTTLHAYNLNKIEDKIRRTRDIRNFMLYSAPWIVTGLVGLSSLFPAKIIISNFSGVIDEVGSSSKSIFPFIGAFWKKIRDWLKFLVVGYTIYYLIHFMNPELIVIKSFILDIIIANLYYYKLFFKVGIVINIYFIIKYMLMIYFYILFSKGKMEMPIYLPKTTLDWLEYIKGASTRLEKGVFIGIYTRYVLVYVFLIFLYSFVIYIF